MSARAGRPQKAPKVRRATARDVGAITAIYNEAVRTTTATMDTDPKTVPDRMKWMAEHTGRYSVLVAEDGGDEVVGWASTSRWSDRPAYDGTGETSVYVISPWRGKGVGRALMGALLEEARLHKFHTLIARVTTDNAVSVHLHEALGFTNVGVMREVGFKFGKRHDVMVLQLMLAKE